MLQVIWRKNYWFCFCRRYLILSKEIFWSKVRIEKFVSTICVRDKCVHIYWMTIIFWFWIAFEEDGTNLWVTFLVTCYGNFEVNFKRGHWSSIKVLEKKTLTSQIKFQFNDLYFSTVTFSYKWRIFVSVSLYFKRWLGRNSSCLNLKLFFYYIFQSVWFLKALLN